MNKSLFFIALVVSALTLSCANTAPSNNQQQPQSLPSPSPSPSVNEAQEALEKIYQDAVVIDVNQAHPLMTGDFNGDGSEDIGIIVRPVKDKLVKINSEYANWILEDPHKTTPARVVESDLLLVIIHGYQKEGWHHQYARQTFLLKNAVGENIQAISRRDLDINKFSEVKGDVIAENPATGQGFIFWSSPRYVWHQG